MNLFSWDKSWDMEFSAEQDRLIFDIEQYLIQEGASDYVQYFLRFNYDKIRRGEVTLILAPIDAALQRLVDRSGKSLDEISNLPEGKNMLENYLSSTPIQSASPVYRAINGSYLRAEADLIRLKRTSTIQFKNLTVETVDGIINMPGQLDRLKKVDSRNLVFRAKNVIIGGNSATNFDDLPNPIIRMIALNFSLDAIINTCRISILFNRILCKSEDFWNEKTRRDFPQQVMINGGWKHTYRVLSLRAYIFGYGVGGGEYGDNTNNLVPVLVKDFSGAIFIACGTHSTVLISGGKLYTFSNNQMSLKPRVVEGLDNVTFIAYGMNHKAVISNNKLYTFGEGIHGQLGHGYNHNEHDIRLLEGLNGVTMVACGSDHTAVISNNQLYTFGYGHGGRLGHGDSQDQNRPKLVEGLDNVTFVACGSGHTIVISNNKLYTFGEGTQGQLGHGDDRSQNRPKLVQGLNNCTFVAACGNYTAVVNNKNLYTFGTGSRGQLGQGDRDLELIPKLIEGMNDVTMISCGTIHMAAISNNRLYTFGSGQDGRLGHGDDRSQNRPKLVEALSDVSFVSCGHNNTGVIAN